MARGAARRPHDRARDGAADGSEGVGEAALSSGREVGMASGQERPAEDTYLQQYYWGTGIQLYDVHVVNFPAQVTLHPVVPVGSGLVTLTQETSFPPGASR